ncbi:MAG: hypothetical protein JXB13_11700, partial [Phycisphaerae bacterium]|nr:hypothetical protein [Phycisphaerae bacterium]
TSCPSICPPNPDISPFSPEISGKTGHPGKLGNPLSAAYECIIMGAHAVRPGKRTRGYSVEK